MSTTISLADMRERLLAGLQRPSPASDDWIAVLGSAKNRALLAIIGQSKPTSIGELADLAARAQPNVSRSLSSLHASGLVDIVNEGRRSIPVLTSFGREKAEELGLLQIATSPLEQRPAAWIHVQFANAECAEQQLFETDDVVGSLSLDIWLKEASEAVGAKWKGDLTEWSSNLIRDWWRLLYRRDAPLRFLDVWIDERVQRAAVSLRSSGKYLSLRARSAERGPLELDRRYSKIDPSQFEHDIIELCLRRIVDEQRRRGQLDRPLQSALTRLIDSREDPGENAFCRTAGALGLSPYRLNEACVGLVSRLLSDIEDEDSRLDFASSVLPEELGQGLSWAQDEVQAHADGNAMPSLAAFRREFVSSMKMDALPWRRGQELARALRRRLSLPVEKEIGGVEGLARLLDVGRFELSSHAPGALRAFQAMSGESPVIVVENEGPISSTFILSRAIGDYLSFGNEHACVANIYTDRQAVGRAFAAELIAPGEGVVSMVEEGHPDYKIERHYGVSQAVIRRQYENYQC